MNSGDIEDAKVYLEASEAAGGQNETRWRALQNVVFGEADSVLDVGCGPGVACREIATRVNSVTGIDISKSMIDVARQLNAAPNIQYLVSDAHTFGDYASFKEQQFDKIICLCVLHWCGDQRKVLQNVFQCLKPDGEFILSFVLQSQLLSNRCNYGETCDTWLRSHHKWAPYLKDYDHLFVDWLHAEEFLDTLRSIGFKIKTWRTGDVMRIRWNDAHIKDHIRSLVGHLRAIPDYLRDECVDDIHDWLVEVTPKTPVGMPMGPIGLMEDLLVVATK